MKKEMKRLKDIDFDENAIWLEKLTDKERKKLKRIFYKYIKWKYPFQTLHKDKEEDMFNAFMDGLLVGMLDV